MHDASLDNATTNIAVVEGPPPLPQGPPPLPQPLPLHTIIVDAPAAAASKAQAVVASPDSSRGDAVCVLEGGEHDTAAGGVDNGALKLGDMLSPQGDPSGSIKASGGDVSGSSQNVSPVARLSKPGVLAKSGSMARQSAGSIMKVLKGGKDDAAGEGSLKRRMVVNVDASTTDRKAEVEDEMDKTGHEVEVVSERSAVRSGIVNLPILLLIMGTFLTIICIAGPRFKAEQPGCNWWVL